MITDEQWEIIKQMAEDGVKILNLESWSIDYEEDTSLQKSNYDAITHIARNEGRYLKARISFNSDIFNDIKNSEDIDSIHILVMHELLHIFFNDSEEFIDKLIAISKLSNDSKELLRSWYDSLHERDIQKLSKIVLFNEVGKTEIVDYRSDK